MKKLLLYSLYFLLMNSCMTTAKIRSVLNYEDAKFEMKPYIICDDGVYFLRYKVISEKKGFSNRMQLSHVIQGDSLFYFFVGQTSYREYENMVNFKITDTKMIDCIKNTSVYWVNSDHSKIPLTIK